MSSFELYVLLTLPAIRNALMFLFIGGAILCVLIMFAINSDNKKMSKEDKQSLKGAVNWFFAFITLAFLTVLVPTDRIVYALIAYDLGSIENMSNVPTEYVDYLKELLKEEIASIRKE